MSYDDFGYERAPWYIYYSERHNEASVIQADRYDLLDYDSNCFLSKAFDSEEEAQLALDHLTLIVNPDRLLQLARWMKGNT